MYITLRGFSLPMVILASSCLFNLARTPATNAAELTATFTAGTTYNASGNWNIAQVPLNNVTDQFNVIIPASFSVMFDVDPPSQINDFTLAANSSFTVPGGHSLTVLDDTSIAGTITASSTNSLFQATGDGAAFHPSGARLIASGGGTIRIAATSFTNASLTGAATQFSADGGGSLLDLSSLQTYSEIVVNSQTRTISATNNGTINLSSVGTIANTGTGTVRFHVASGGNINLSSLTTVSGRTIFDVDNASYTLPALNTTSGTEVQLANGTTFTANALTDFVGGSVVYSGNNPGTFQANSLNRFNNSSISLAPGQQFNVKPTGLVDIDSSQISVRGGRQFGATEIAATSFTNSFLTGTVTQFSADGVGSLLDLSSLFTYGETVSQSGTRTVSATNGGTIDLSSVGTITQSGTGTMRFHVASGGTINLANLTTVSGRTIFDVDNASYSLPSVTTLTGTEVQLANGTTVTANAMTDFVNGAITYTGNNPGTIQTNSLNRFENSSISLAPGQQFNVKPTGLVDIDSSQISVRGGRQFGATEIAATSFTNSSRTGTVTQFSADGAGSLLDLSSLLTYSETVVQSGTRAVSATNNGTINLSSVGTIANTGTGTLRFQANSGGKLKFGKFNTSGNIQFAADGSDSVLDVAGSVNLANAGSLTLTNAATLRVEGDFLFSYTNGAAWNLNAGILAIEGPNRHFLEVGGRDLGVNGATSGNFGIGQLVVGTETEPALAILTEINNNGNRISDREALYLYGLGGPDGLRLLSGSTLVIGNIDTYAFIDGEMVHLNSLFGPEVTSIPFDEGFIVADALSGDYDNDGDVDGRDFLLWQRLYGTNDPAADGDGNGIVGQGDLWVWQAYYGESIQALPLRHFAVPEPSTAILLAVMAMSGLLRFPRSLPAI